MASKVNVKFVAILSVALLLAASGVAFFGYSVLANSGSDHERRGDELMAAGDYGEAAKAYGKAVFKDQGNIRWLEKWREALSKMTPETDTAYTEAYRDFFSANQRLAIVQPSSAEAQATLLDMRYEEATRGGATSAVWERLAQDVTTALELLPEGDPEAERLRRYRALSQLNRLGDADFSEVQLDEIRADLEAALAADPQDVDSALGVAELEAFSARRAFRMGQSSTADALWEQSLATLDEVAARFDESSRASLRKLEIQLDRATAKAATPAEETAARRALAEGLVGVMARAEQSDPAELSPAFLQRLGARLSGADAPREVRERWMALVERAGAAQQDNALMQVVLGQSLRQMDGSEEAYEVFDRLAKLPDLPVSLEGRLRREVRRRALSERATDALLMWESTGKSEEWKQKLDASRREMAGSLGASSPATLRLDGQIAFIEGRMHEAIRKFTELNSSTGSSDPQSLALLAAALEREGTLGGALEQYDRILMLMPGNVQAELQAASIELRMDRVDAARERYERVLRSDPTNETALQRLAAFGMLSQEQGGTGTQASAIDPSVLDDATRALYEAERLLRQAEPEIARAQAILADAIEKHPEDARLVKRLARSQVQAEDLGGALATATEGAERFPNDRELQAMRIALETGDPLETELRLIELGEGSDLEKRIQRFAAHRRALNHEEANEILDGLLADHPNDERVVEAGFVRALEQGDFAAARRLAAAAAAGNHDQVNGLLYQARIELATGDNAEAMASLTRAQEALPHSAPIWRLLAQAQMATGRVDAAMESFRRALELKPDDVPTLRSYTQALLRIGRQESALAMLRDALDVVRRDPALREAWLSLEEQYGRRDRAIALREQRMQSEPNNIENAAALARLYMREARWEEARTIIERMPQDGDAGLVRTALAASWHGEQGQVDAGRQVFLQRLAGLQEPSEKSRTYIAMGDYLSGEGWDDQAIEAFREGRALERGENAEADRRLGDLYFMRGRYDEAVERYRSILKAGEDPGSRVAKRVAEALVRLERYDEAEAALKELEAKEGRSLETVMLLANVAEGRDDLRRARELVNEAVAMAPTNPLPFMRRAQLFFDDQTQFNNVLEDLDQALRLQPDNVRALMLRVRLLMNAGRFNEALTSFEKAVAERPTDDELRLNYVRQLLALQRFDDAKIAVARAAEVRGSAEPVWYVNAGDVYAGTGEPRAAIAFYQRAYDAFDRRLGRLAPLIDVMLKTTPPQTQPAQALLAAHPRTGEANEDLVLKLLRARVVDKLQNKPEDENGDPITEQTLLAEAWEMARGDDQLVRVWFEQALLVFENDLDGMMAMVRSLGQPTPPILRVLMAGPMSTDPSRWDAALAELSGLEDQIRDPAALVSLHRARGQLYYGMGRYEEAAGEFRRSLEIDPESAEFNNNLAFTMAQHLGDPQGALKYARKAEELAPNDPNVLDTIGVIHMNLGQLDEAERKLSRAMSLALPQAAEQRFSSRLHMAMLREKQGRTSDAMDLALDARRIMETSPFLREAYGKDLEALLERLGL